MPTTFSGDSGRAGAVGRRALLGLSLLAAFVPWASACMLTVAVTLVTGGRAASRQWLHDLLGTPAVGLPLVLAAAAYLALAVLVRAGVHRSDQWWLVGGVLAAAAVVVSGALGLAWGGGYVLAVAVLWSMLSGHALFVFLMSALWWSRRIPAYIPASWQASVGSAQGTGDEPVP